MTSQNTPPSRRKDFCPACVHAESQRLISFGVIPLSGSFLEDPGQPVVKKLTNFFFCTRCALIHKQACDGILPDYEQKYRATSAQMPIYLPEIIGHLSQVKPPGDFLVIDVGGNDGGFLNILRKEGYTNRLNIEPSVFLSEISARAGHAVENVHLDQKEAVRIKRKYGPADLIICRHVLEHVADPIGLLSAIRFMMKEDGLLFLETPNARGIFEELLVHELWDEHLFHFTLSNLSFLLEGSGFQVDASSIMSHRGGTNLLIWARKGLLEKARKLHCLEGDVALCRSFSARWERLKDRIQRQISECPKPVYCIGASHPQSNYLLFSGIGAYVDCLIDDDPFKIGRYVPVPEPVQVLSTKQALQGTLPGTILRTAFGCDAWMDQICKPMAQKGVPIREPYPEEGFI